jgi:hypothetical protein
VLHEARAEVHTCRRVGRAAREEGRELGVQRRRRLSRRCIRGSAQPKTHMEEADALAAAASARLRAAASCCARWRAASCAAFSLAAEARAGAVDACRAACGTARRAWRARAPSRALICACMRRLCAQGGWVAGGVHGRVRWTRGDDERLIRADLLLVPHHTTRMYDAQEKRRSMYRNHCHSQFQFVQHAEAESSGRVASGGKGEWLCSVFLCPPRRSSQPPLNGWPAPVSSFF